MGKVMTDISEILTLIFPKISGVFQIDDEDGYVF